MKNKHWKKINTAVELTSLLDVIFIVLMIVVCNQQINLTERQTELEQQTVRAEAMMQEAQAKQDEASEVIASQRMDDAQLENYNELMQNSIVVYVDYTPSDITTRRIRIRLGDEDLPVISVTPGNSDLAFNEFEKTLENRVEEMKDSPMIITIDTTNILYRDEVRVNEIIERLSQNHSNLFFKVISEE